MNTMKAEITKWYQNKEVAFAIGVDELPIGGSYHSGPKKEKWDSFYWYRTKNNFWTKYWKPILDKNPWIKYSLGWVPNHTSFLNTRNYPEPQGVDKKELSWETPTGKQWIKEVMMPIFAYGSKQYDAYTVHGYYHEIPMSYYYPYWNKQAQPKEWPYNDPKFFENELKSIQKVFKQTWKHNALTLNTFPFGGARPDSPHYLSKNGIYAAGFWLDMKDVKEIDPCSGLKTLKKGTKSYKRPLGSPIEPEGTWYDNRPTHTAIVGDIRYWEQDADLIKSGGKIIGVPYSLSLEGTTRNFKKRVKQMIKEYNKFDAPTLYYFMHAQMDWIDALGGSSPMHLIKGFLEEIKFPYLNNINFSQKKTKYITGLITLASIALAMGLNSIPFVIISALLIVTGLISRIKIYGLNARKHDKQMQWLYKNYVDKIWTTDISTLTQYYDLRKRSKITQKGKVITMDTRNCFDWDGREIPITLKLDREIKKCKVKNKIYTQESSTFLEIHINPKDKQTEIQLID